MVGSNLTILDQIAKSPSLLPPSPFCPFRRPPTSPTLVAVTITLFIAIAIARLPPLSPLP
jgi:hypothetical protein